MSRRRVLRHLRDGFAHDGGADVPGVDAIIACTGGIGVG